MYSIKKIFTSVIATLLVLLSISSAFPYSPNYKNGNELRTKREHSHGITGPVHTYVKTDKHANFKWGVRHHVGHHYAGK